MSGGAYDYAFARIQQTAMDIKRAHQHQPHVVAFAELLYAMGDALYAIEWADSGDTCWDEALDAKIRAVVPAQAELAVSVAQAQQVLQQLTHALARAEAAPSRGTGPDAARE